MNDGLPLRTPGVHSIIDRLLMFRAYDASPVDVEADWPSEGLAS